MKKGKSVLTRLAKIGGILALTAVIALVLYIIFTIAMFRVPWVRNMLLPYHDPLWMYTYKETADFVGDTEFFIPDLDGYDAAYNISMSTGWFWGKPVACYVGFDTTIAGQPHRFTFAGIDGPSTKEPYDEYRGVPCVVKGPLTELKLGELWYEIKGGIQSGRDGYQENLEFRTELAHEIIDQFLDY